MGSLTRAPLSMLEHELDVEAGEVILSDGREYVAGNPEESDESLAMMLDANNCRFDADSGTLVLVQKNKAVVRINGFSDILASSASLGRRGARGQIGKTGRAGRNGRDGKRGKDGCAGRKGDTGAQGNTGETGATGARGATGATGSTGATGATGSRGSDAVAGEVTVNENGMAECVVATLRKTQCGKFEADERYDHVTVLFPVPFEEKCHSFVAFHHDNDSVTARECKILEMDKGGVTLSVPYVAPIEDPWSFFWIAMGK